MLAVPRNLKGTNRLFALLDKEPPELLQKLAFAWVDQGYVGRGFDAPVLLELTDHDVAAAAHFLESTGIKLQIADVDNRHTLVEQRDETLATGHGAAMRWILAIVWIYLRIQPSRGV